MGAQGLLVSPALHYEHPSARRVNHGGVIGQDAVSLAGGFGKIGEVRFEDLQVPGRNLHV